jgi:DNA-binding YbaB/EbfC family protein
MKDFGKMIKQAKQMQEQLQQMQEQLREEQIEGTAGGGMVTVTMNGRYEVQAVKIDPEVVDREEIEMLEDLVAAACNDARVKIEEKLQEEMGKMTGGLGLPPGLF